VFRAARLGDDIDDYCVKCKRIMNHSVVSIVNDEPAKVRCRTCHSDHDYRHEQAPPPKVDPRKAALFNQVLGNVKVPSVAADGVPATEEVPATDEVPAADEIPVADMEALAKARTEPEEALAEAKPKGRKKVKA
jgi:hypothetical protein